MKRLGIAIAAALLMGAGSGLPAAAGLEGQTAERLIAARTGEVGTLLPGAGVALTAGAHRVRPANGMRTWMQDKGSSLRLVAELPAGRSSGTFEELIPQDWTMRQEPGGGLTILDADGNAKGRIAAPWALDATGRSLPTRYLPEGTDLHQVVETDGATYPIVMDPWITNGTWYRTPVYYVELSWSETWALKNAVDREISSAPVVVCGYIPTTTAKAACTVVFLAFKSDVKAAVNTAIRTRRCYKVRMPALQGAAFYLAYDSYQVTCRR